MRQYGGRAVWVHLPPGYDASRADPYPLFILHDGQNLFASRPEAMGGSWRADEAFGRAAAEGLMPPTVLAGIDHAGPRRIEEFAPPGFFRRGGARAYGDLVFDDIIPGLSRDFHVRTDAAGLGLGGSSMGGLVSLWIAAMRPARIGQLIVMSPSVWWNRRSILRVLKRQPIDPRTRVWVDAGALEGPRVTRDAQAVADVLLGQGHRQVKYVEDPDGDHSESSWARRLPAALGWLAGAQGA
jgi:enterochelin esterase-like enzyme